MKKSLLLFIANLVSIASILGQSTTGITTIKTEDGKVTRCYTTQKTLEAIQADPTILARRARVEQQVNKFMERNPIESNSKNMPPVYTIPVVVHILYRTGAMNLPDLRVFEQIQVLNDDYRRTNADAANTPSTFSGIVADSEIEFCLATRDPSGNPTTGITRTSTTVSNIGQGSAYYSTAAGGKTIWDPTKYLNIWVCELGGGLLGFTYTPGNAPNGADGVVIGYQYFGKTGASAGYDGGRTTTHEVGHWLNLEHIWGDAAGCTPDDLVADTPPQDQEYGGCPTHPQVTCGGPNMFMNYMDYVQDDCMNSFTTGQKTRMRAAINAARPGLLTSLGCTPNASDDAGISEINSPVGTICATSFTPQVTIKNYGGSPLTSAVINYRIDGGTTLTQTWTGNLTVTQTALVSLSLQTVTGGAHTFEAWTTLPNGNADANGSNDSYSTPFSIAGGGLALPYFQGFEAVTFPPTGWTAFNADSDVTWARTTTAKKTGVASMFMDNWDYNAHGQIDRVTMPALNMSNSASVTMTFQLAYSLYSATGYSDTLRVHVSDDCGQTWTEVYEKFDNALSTTGTLATVEFVPTANQFRLETIDLSAYGNSTDVQIRFEHVSDYENNMHIDDINISNVLTGNAKLQPKSSLQVYPNPTTGLLNIDLQTPSEQDVQIMVFNSLGQLVSQVSDSKVTVGNYKLNMTDLAKGVYHVQVMSGGEVMTQKVILN